MVRAAHESHGRVSTRKNLIRALKFNIIDDVDTATDKSCTNVFGIIGFNLTRISKVVLMDKDTKKLKAMMKKLGHTPPTRINVLNLPEVVKIAHQQYPTNEKVYETCVKAWCMAPTSIKSKKRMESFRQGKEAEPLIHKHIKQFIADESNGCLGIQLQFEVGLTKNPDITTAAVSPDALSIMSFTKSENPTTIEVTLANFINSGHMKMMRQEDSIDHSADYLFMVAHEYKHKSSIITVSQTHQIVTRHLNNQKFVVLDLSRYEHEQLFQKAIPSVDYRCQMMFSCIHIHILFNIHIHVFIFTYS